MLSALKGRPHPEFLRRLVKFHPERTPQNIETLTRSVQAGAYLESWMKQDIIRAAVWWSTLNRKDVTPEAIDLCFHGQTVPPSSLLQVMRIQRRFGNDAVALRIYKYVDLKKMLDNIPLQCAFISYFGSKLKYKPLTLKVARTLLESPYIEDENVKFIVVQSLLAIREFEMVTTLHNTPISRQMAGPFFIAYSVLGDIKNRQKMLKKINNQFTDLEMSWIVKYLSSDDALELLQTVDPALDDQPGVHTMIQLATKAIREKDSENFEYYIQRLGDVMTNGTAMVLKVDWHYRNGTFPDAKKEYQLATDAQPRQKHIALKMLEVMVSDEGRTPLSESESTEESTTPVEISNEDRLNREWVQNELEFIGALS